MFFPGKPSGRAAGAYAWTQTDWITGSTANAANHTNQIADNIPWTEYASNPVPNPSITSATTGEIKLNTTNTSWRQTDWSNPGTADASVKAYAPTDRDNTWTKFSSLDQSPSYIKATDAGKLRESPQPGSDVYWTQTAGGNEGTMNGGMSATLDGNLSSGRISAGKFSNALSFDGVDDYVSVPVGNGLPIYKSNADYSVSFWVKGSSAAIAISGYIFGEGNNTTNTPVLGFAKPTALTDKMSVFLRDDAAVVKISASSSIAVFDNAWHHIVWIDTGTSTRTSKMYIDGVLDGTFNGTLTYTPSTITFNTSAIGSLVRTTVSNYFPGSVDDVRVFSKALSSPATSCAADDPTNTVYDICKVMNNADVSDHLMSHWNFNESSGSVVGDNTQTISGSTSYTPLSGTSNSKDHSVVSGIDNLGGVQFCDFDHSSGGLPQPWTPTDGDATGYDLNGTPGTPNGTIEVAGVHCGISTFTVAAGTTYVKAYDGTSKYGKFVVYAQNATITGTLDATGKGYAGGTDLTGGNGSGPGGGINSDASWSGAGYGGMGGKGYRAGGEYGPVYGSITSPNDLGSGGAGTSSGCSPNNSGGGLIKLNISGTLTNNGTITANGNSGIPYCSAGGSGGTIYIYADKLAGSNVAAAITANGGNGPGSGAFGSSGGGGRIALYYGDKSGYLGLTPTAYGGSSAYTPQAGAGTVYEKATSQSFGDLIINNNAISGASTPISDTPDAYTFDNLTIKGAATLAILSGKTVTTAGGGTFILDTNGTFTTVNTALTVNGTLDLKTGLSVNASTKKLTFGSAGNLIIRSGVTLTHDANSTTAAGQVNYIDWTMASVIIENTGAINVDGKGYSGYVSNGGNGNGNGPGAGMVRANATVSGASYGGAGASVTGGGPGSVYDGSSCLTSGTSYTIAKCLGSGGAALGISPTSGGNGGGMVRLNLSTSINLNSTGIISANGGVGVRANSGCGGAGGSGGSIYINTLAISGSGSISANGGNSAAANGYNGGGGGGRIVIYYTNGTIASTISKIAGTGGSVAAVAGTYYQKVEASYAANKDVAGGTLSYTPESNQNIFAGNDQINNLTIQGDKSKSINQISEKIHDPGIISTIKSYLSKITSSVKSIFALAFSVPTTHAATPGYSDTGTYTSPVFDSGGTATFKQISWTNPTLPSGATLTFQISSSNCANGETNYPTCSGASNWTYYGSYTTSPADTSAVPEIQNKRYVRYKITFYDPNYSASLMVNDVTVKYSLNGYPTFEQSITSSPYKADIGNDDNSIISFSWTELNHLLSNEIDYPSSDSVNSYAKIQIRTAPDNSNSPGTWGAWVGGGGNDTYFGYDPGSSGCTKTVLAVNCTIPIGSYIYDGTRDNHWIQYRATFLSEGTETAIIDSISIGYKNNLTGAFISSPYNTEKSYSVLKQIV